MNRKYDDSDTRHSRLISRVLSPALRLWLRSQVEAVSDLQFQIVGADRQLLSGYIPKVLIAARNAIYQGIHLSRVEVTGEEIRINLGQILRGKPLQLLEVVPVVGEMVLHQQDLTASLSAPLMVTALSDLLNLLLQPSIRSTLPPEWGAILSQGSIRLNQPQIQLGHQQLTLGGNLVTEDDRAVPFLLRTGITLASGSQIRLDQPELIEHLHSTQGVPLPELQNFEIDLGAEVSLQELRVEPDQMICRGRINIVPA